LTQGSNRAVPWEAYLKIDSKLRLAIEMKNPRLPRETRASSFRHKPKVKPEAARLKSSLLTSSGDVGAGGFYVDGVEGLAGGHEEAVAFGAAEDDVAADFWKADLADFFARGVDDVDAVIAVADPAGTGPDVAAFVAADAVVEAGGVGHVR